MREIRYPREIDKTECAMLFFPPRRAEEAEGAGARKVTLTPQTATGTANRLPRCRGNGQSAGRAG